MREALQSGEVLPFARLQERIVKACNCRILAARLENEKGDGRRLLIYEVKGLQADGRILKLEVDAQSGSILKLKRKGYRKDTH